MQFFRAAWMADYKDCVNVGEQSEADKRFPVKFYILFC